MAENTNARLIGPHISLTLDDRLEVWRYMAFRTVRHIRDKVCKDAEGRKLLTRIMQKLRAA